MKIHSIVGVITNSSSVAYIFAQENGIECAKAFFNMIMEDVGAGINVDDVYEFSLVLDKYYAGDALDAYLNELYEGEERYCGDGILSSTLDKEREIIGQFLSDNGIDINDKSQLEEIDGAKLISLTKELHPILEEALTKGEIKLDGWDGMFSDVRLTRIKIKSKVSGKEFILEDEIKKFMNIECGNDNY